MSDLFRFLTTHSGHFFLIDDGMGKFTDKSQSIHHVGAISKHVADLVLFKILVYSLLRPLVKSIGLSHVGQHILSG